MDRGEVILILDSLANGKDPSTGADIPHDTFHKPNTIRALFTASSLLKGLSAAAPARRGEATTVLTSAGAPWSDEEDTQVCCEFDAKMTISQIALQKTRTARTQIREAKHC